MENIINGNNLFEEQLQVGGVCGKNGKPTMLPMDETVVGVIADVAMMGVKLMGVFEIGE